MVPERMDQPSLFDQLSAESPILVFDLETQNLFEDVGGYQNTHLLRVSIAVTYNVTTREFKNYSEHTVDELIDDLFNAKLVVGYNVLHFDYRVLEAYTQRQLSQIKTLDMLDHLHRRLGFRVKLDSLAETTLGTHKEGTGLEAVEWWRSGEIDKLLSYCRKDVQITHDVYQYGKQHGCVWISSRGTKQKVPVDW